MKSIQLILKTVGSQCGFDSAELGSAQVGAQILLTALLLSVPLRLCERGSSPFKWPKSGMVTRSARERCPADGEWRGGAREGTWGDRRGGGSGSRRVRGCLNKRGRRRWGGWARIWLVRPVSGRASRREVPSMSRAPVLVGSVAMGASQENSSEVGWP